MNESIEKIAPVIKEVQVEQSPEAAFQLFTDGIASWWPLTSHSVGEEQALTCTLEGKLGGRIYETLADGRQEDWGTVTVWEPPQRLAFTWHPGADPTTATKVEVTFRGIEGGTQIELTHRGWEVLGERGAHVRQNYDSGWDLVLGGYSRKARD